jgi:hypothetical protein
MLLAAPGVVLIAPAPVRGGQTYLREADAARAIFPEKHGLGVRKTSTSPTRRWQLSRKHSGGESMREATPTSK